MERYRRALEGKPSAEQRLLLELRLRQTKLAMDKTVVLLNIEYLRRALAEEANEARRQRLLGWLDEEKMRLAAVDELLHPRDEW